MAGRPTKLTPDTQRRICEALSVGATYELAAQYGGIDYHTFNLWMKRGERASQGEFLEFYQAVKKAEADAAYKWLDLIDKASIDQWQAAAWKLERRYPQQWGARQKIDLNATVVAVDWDDDKDADSN